MRCGKCGARMKRVHRTFLERFRYMAIYECRNCDLEESAPRRYTYHFGENCRCPKCGTFRITKLKERDKIDRMHTGFLNLMERLVGGQLYHCRFCRLQFFDRRSKLEPKAAEAAAVEPASTPVSDPAPTDARG